jgi:hypothetical protein
MDDNEILWEFRKHGSEIKKKKMGRPKIRTRPSEMRYTKQKSEYKCMRK